MINVVWQSYHKERPNRGYWDQTMLEEAFSRKTWSPVRGNRFVHRNGFGELPEGSDGAIVIIPARYHAGDTDAINKDLSRLQWCLVVLVGDEEAAFPCEKLSHPNMAIYVMTPHIGKHPNADRFIVNGYTPQTHEMLKKYGAEAMERPLRWFFAGQINHERRKAWAEEMRKMEGGKLVETPGFTKGLPQEDYYRYLASAKVAPCPSGAVVPDSFRIWEALEAGCMPVVDRYSPKVSEGNYWQFLLGENILPFQVVDKAIDLPGNVAYHFDTYPVGANRAFAWWQFYKRKFAYDLEKDIARLGGDSVEAGGLLDRLTVLVPTSPIESHPDTSRIETTIASLRERLPESEIILMIDGVREEQKEYTDRYNEYVRRLLWKANFEWHNVLPLLFPTHHHQAEMTRLALRLVKTPTILFVEHDTPLQGHAPFVRLVAIIESGEANVIRLHHESEIKEEHKYLMLDEIPPRWTVLGGAPLLRTAQWSQRPHVASTDFYREIIGTHFSDHSNTMIEDRIYGVVEGAYKLRGNVGWSDFKLWIYAPEGDMKRSTHLDGRGKSPKYEMVF